MNPRWSTAIANEHGGEILRWYEGLEAQVMDFTNVVSPHGNNQQVWSSELATVLVEACCLIESIFYHFKDDAATEQGKSKPGAHLTLGNYADLFGGLLRLPERRAILLIDILEYRCPFASRIHLLNGVPFDAAKHVPGWWDL